MGAGSPMGKMSSFGTAVLCSVTLHGALLVLLIWGWVPEYRPRDVVQPRYIEASLLADIPKAKPVAKPPVAPPSPPPPKVDRQREQLQKQQEAARQAEQKRQQDQQRKLAEQKRQQEQKRQADAQRKREEEARRKAREAELAQAISQEEAVSESLEDSELVSTYEAYIQELIGSYWSRPPSARNGMQVELQIQLAPTGRVISVAVTRSSGNGAFDRAAEQAVYKVERFERLQELANTSRATFERQFRRFKLVFRPEDLRQ